MAGAGFTLAAVVAAVIDQIAGGGRESPEAELCGGRQNDSLESTEPCHFRFPLIPHEVYEKLPPELKFQNRKDAVLSQAMIVYVSGSYVDVFGKEHHVADCLSSVGAEFHPCFASNRHY
jgi:hypothetical protein